MNARKIQEAVDALQSVKEQISALELKEKVLVDSLKEQGVGTYKGTYADLSVTEIEQSRIDVPKLVKKLGIPEWQFNKFYKIVTTQLRAKIVNKTISK